VEGDRHGFCYFGLVAERYRLGMRID
jgi:hypothetical protein